MSESKPPNWIYTTGLSALVALGVGVVAYTMNRSGGKEKKGVKKGKGKEKKGDGESKTAKKEKKGKAGKNEEDQEVSNAFSLLSEEMKYKKLYPILNRSLNNLFPQLLAYRNSIKNLIESDPKKYKSIEIVVNDLDYKLLPSVLNNNDKSIIEYIRNLSTLSSEKINNITLLTKFTIVIYITLYHSARYIEKNAIAIGEIRNDYDMSINLLKSDMKNIKNMTFDEQYAYVIFICWLANRTQNGPILVELLNIALPLLTKDNIEMDIMCIPQLLCAASLVGKWSDVKILGDIMNKSNPDVFKERCTDYHEFAKNHPRLYLDLQQIYDLSSVESALPLDAASQLIFSKYNWQQSTIRSGRFRRNKDSEWEELTFNKQHTLIRTGLIYRMSSDISSLLGHYDGNMILSGTVVENRISLSGYDFLLNDEEKPEFYCRDQINLVSKQLTTAEGLSREFWVGTYTHTKSRVEVKNDNESIQIELLDEESQREEDTIEDIESIDEDLAKVLKVIRKEIEKKKKGLVEDVKCEIELEFSPFTNIIEHPKEIYFNFGDDLVRFTNLIDTITKAGN